MKWVIIGTFTALTILLLIGAGIAEATHDAELGVALTTQNNAGLGLRCWFLGAGGFLVDLDCADRPTAVEFQLDAGQSISIEYQEAQAGATPPLAPTNILIQVRVDDSATSVITLHNGPSPGNFATFTFWSTTTGLATGTPAAGTYRLYIEVERDAGVPATDYVTTCDQDQASPNDDFCGVMRGRMVVSTLADAGPPAGSQYAFNIPSESVIVTATHSRGFTNDNRGVSIHGRDDTTAINEKTIITTFGTTGSTTAALVVNNDYVLAPTQYDTVAQITGISDLSGLPYTIYAATGHGAGLTRESDTVLSRDKDYTADPTVRIDTHPQRDTTLIKDNFPTEDATEDLAYIIGEDVISIWAHVVNSRTEDLDTAAGSVVVSIRNPSDVEQDTLTTQTGADGWTPASLDFGVAAPSGSWTARAIFTATGASAQDDEPVVFQSPFSANKQIRLFFASDLTVGVNHTFIARIELDDHAFTPDTTPMIRISRYVMDDTGAGQFLQYEDVVTWRNMTNTFDLTENPIGATYFFNWTVPEAGVYGVSVRSNITGTLIRQHEPVDAAGAGVFSVLGAGFIGLSDEVTFTILAWGLVLGLAWWQRFYVLAFWVSLTLIAALIPSDPIPTSVGLIMAVIIAWVHILTRWGTSLMQPRERTA